MDYSRQDLLPLVARVVSAHLANNSAESEALPEIIRSVYAALSRMGDAPALVLADPVRPEPAVPAKKSVFADHIVCLEDGKSFKTLKRHLQAEHGMTPAEYRERWDLPPEYPIVAPDYADRRSDLAKRIGLGRKAPKSAAAPSVDGVRRIPEGVSGKKRGRSRKAG